MKRSSIAAALSVCLAAAACGSSNDDDRRPAKAEPDEPDPGDGPRSQLPGSKELISGDWTLPPGSEGYVCVRQTVSEDIYVNSWEAINPLGTHHTALSMGDPSGPDGVTKCAAAENHALQIFGSGVGTNPIVYPEGVAVKVKGGSQILLNLHLFNSSEEELSGTSAVNMVTVPADEVQFIGQSLAAGAFGINLPPNQEGSLPGTCTISGDSTIFGVVPHMHQLGIHMKVVAHSSIEGDRVLHDGPYDFDLQLFHPVDPIKIANGDKVDYECTWMNTTPRTVSFGDSTLDEMCFVGLYRYPAGESSFCYDFARGL